MKNVEEMSALEFARFRVEMTRRELHKLLAAVECGTEMGRELCDILVKAICEVEELAATEDEDWEGCT